jgi:hypothetical protein
MAIQSTVHGLLKFVPMRVIGVPTPLLVGVNDVIVARVESLV